MIVLFDRVRLKTDRYAAEGATLGALGYVIEIHPDGALEIEISASDGTTTALFVAQRDDVELAPERE